jgi:hypothetical protein
MSSYYGSFDKIETKLKKYPIIGFDSEDDSKGTPTLFSFYSEDGPYTTRHWQDAMDYIYSIETPSIFVAHNLEYDIANLFKADDYFMVEEMIYASKLLRVNMFGTKHFFINSGSFFYGSLAQMGEFIGLEKLEGNALDEKYVHRDAEIVQKWMKGFQDKLVDTMGVNLGITIGQMAMNVYRRSYMLDDTQITYNSPNVLKAYYGGRVEICYKGIVSNPKVSDINSCYPTVMANYEYPDTSEIEDSSINTHRFGVGKFTVNVPDMLIPPLPYKEKGEGRLFFPVGEFTGVWTYHEIRYAQSLGVKIIKEHWGEGTNQGCRPFEKFVNTYYKLKSDAKQRGDKFEELLFKLWLNNLYGKWCQHKSGSYMARNPMPQSQIDKYKHHPDFSTKKIGPFYSYDIPKLEPPKTANFMWGVYVTSYARTYLHDGIMKVKNAGYTPMYWDTDSIMYGGEGKGNPLPISKKLGDWDVESFDLGIFRQAKGYLLCNKENKDYIIKKVACKGVPTKYAWDFIIEGMATFMKPMRLKEALIRSNAEVNKDKFIKEIGENVWSDVTKEMRSIYIKRVGESGITRPVHVSEIDNLVKTAGQGKRTSIRDDLHSLDISILRPDHKNLFMDTVIPKDWFKYRSKKFNPTFLKHAKLYFLRMTELENIKKGQTWIKGDIFGEFKTKKKKPFYKIYLEIFQGKKAPQNFVICLSKKFFESFGITENLQGKKVAIILKDDYIKDKFPSLKIVLDNSENKYPAELSSTEDEEKITEKQKRDIDKELDKWLSITKQK